MLLACELEAAVDADHDALLLNLVITVLVFSLVVGIRFWPVIEELRNPTTPRFGSKIGHSPAVIFRVIGLVILVLLRIFAT